MTILYHSATGQITGAVTGEGYSGHGAGLNNPNMEQLRGIGPIPRGKWRITKWYDHHADLGPCVAELEPVGHDAFHRTLFRIHGDNEHMNHTASDGCIIANHDNRWAWRSTGQMEFEVV